MSNFDHSIDDGLEELLRAENVYASYSGWDFAGYVWFDRSKGKFACEVWRYKSLQAIYYEETLVEIMDTVCQTWGYG